MGNVSNLSDGSVGSRLPSVSFEGEANGGDTSSVADFSTVLADASMASDTQTSGQNGRGGNGLANTPVLGNLGRGINSIGNWIMEFSEQRSSFIHGQFRDFAGGFADAIGRPLFKALAQGGEALNSGGLAVSTQQRVEGVDALGEGASAIFDSLVKASGANPLSPDYRSGQVVGTVYEVITGVRSLASLGQSGIKVLRNLDAVKDVAAVNRVAASITTSGADDVVRFVGQLDDTAFKDLPPKIQAALRDTLTRAPDKTGDIGIALATIDDWTGANVQTVNTRATATGDPVSAPHGLVEDSFTINRSGSGAFEDGSTGAGVAFFPQGAAGDNRGSFLRGISNLINGGAGEDVVRAHVRDEVVARLGPGATPRDVDLTTHAIVAQWKVEGNLSGLDALKTLPASFPEHRFEHLKSYTYEGALDVPALEAYLASATPTTLSWEGFAGAVGVSPGRFLQSLTPEANQARIKADISEQFGKNFASEFEDFIDRVQSNPTSLFDFQQGLPDFVRELQWNSLAHDMLFGNIPVEDIQYLIGPNGLKLIEHLKSISDGDLEESFWSLKIHILYSDIDVRYLQDGQYPNVIQDEAFHSLKSELQAIGIDSDESIVPAKDQPFLFRTDNRDMDTIFSEGFMPRKTEGYAIGSAGEAVGYTFRDRSGRAISFSSSVRGVLNYINTSGQWRDQVVYIVANDNPSTLNLSPMIKGHPSWANRDVPYDEHIIQDPNGVPSNKVFGALVPVMDIETRRQRFEFIPNPAYDGEVPASRASDARGADDGS